MKNRGSMTPLEYTCDRLRRYMNLQALTVKKLMCHTVFLEAEDFPGQHDEIKANIMLAYRHLEDARMRLGKVMQQIQGGISKLDK